jgi:phosphopantetheinyl transferase
VHITDLSLRAGSPWLCIAATTCRQHADVLARLADEQLLPEDRHRLARTTSTEARKTFSIGRFLIRRVLGSLLGRPHTSMSISIGRNGKPHLSEGGLEFNLSHSGGWFLLGVARSRIGVDLEARPFWSAGLAERFFSRADLDALAASPPTERPARSTRAWVIKEACLKASAMRLADLRHVDVPEAGATWRGMSWTELDLGGPIGAVATSDPAREPGRLLHAQLTPYRDQITVELFDPVRLVSPTSSANPPRRDA